MSLVFMDGFDVDDYPVKGWYIQNGGSSVSGNTPFGQGYSMLLDTGNNVILTHAITPSATVYMGFQFYLNHTDSNQSVLRLYTDNGSSLQISYCVNPAGDINMYCGPENSTLIGTAYNALAFNQWNFIEISATIDPTNGSLIVRKNTEEIISYSGNTKYEGSSNNIDGLWIGNSQDSTIVEYFDDLYICDGLGSVNNTFLGPVRIQTLMPNATGSYNQLTPSPSQSVGDNYVNVKDVPYSDSDYNYSSNIGDKDTYRLETLLPDTASVFAIQTNVIASATDAGAAYIAPALVSGGSLYTDPTVPLSASPNGVSRAVREQDPNTSATWTINGVNTLEAGVEIA